MRVVIVGGGIGGLALGISLHGAGIADVHVLEAAPSVKELGVGINVLPHAVRELTELGLAQELGEAGVATSEVVMFNKHGQRVWAEPRGLSAGYLWSQYSIHRGRLLGILHRAFCDRLGAGRLHLDARVMSTDQSRTSASARLTSGERYEGDVLIGADGVRSGVRGQLHPQEGTPLWNGITMWRATVRMAPILSGSSMVIVGHFGNRAVMYPISAPDVDDRLLMNVVLESKTSSGTDVPPENWTTVADRDQILRHFPTLRTDLFGIAEAVHTADRWLRYPMLDRDPLATWGSGRITLLGDAAHPMYPTGANGASQAILDGRSLAHCLATQPAYETALELYESDRRPATSRLVRANRRVGAEKCLELAEERAPGGFTKAEDLFAPGEREELSLAYRTLAGMEPEVLNRRPSMTVV